MTPIVGGNVFLREVIGSDRGWNRLKRPQFLFLERRELRTSLCFSGIMVEAVNADELTVYCRRIVTLVSSFIKMDQSNY